MERHEVLDLMKALRLSGMRAAFDEIVDIALKRQHPIQRVLGDLLKAEIADKKARSIKYQMAIAKHGDVRLALSQYDGGPDGLAACLNHLRMILRAYETSSRIAARSAGRRR